MSSALPLRRHGRRGRTGRGGPVLHRTAGRRGSDRRSRSSGPKAILRVAMTTSARREQLFRLAQSRQALRGAGPCRVRRPRLSSWRFSRMPTSWSRTLSLAPWQARLRRGSAARSNTPPDHMLDQRLRRNGPLASRKAYDLLIQAESGLASITGGPDEPGACRHLDRRYSDRRHSTCGALLEALIARGRTGRGARHRNFHV